SRITTPGREGRPSGRRQHESANRSDHRTGRAGHRYRRAGLSAHATAAALRTAAAAPQARRRICRAVQPEGAPAPFRAGRGRPWCPLSGRQAVAAPQPAGLPRPSALLHAGRHRRHHSPLSWPFHRSAAGHGAAGRHPDGAPRAAHSARRSGAHPRRENLPSHPNPPWRPGSSAWLGTSAGAAGTAAAGSLGRLADRTHAGRGGPDPLRLFSMPGGRAERVVKVTRPTHPETGTTMIPRILITLGVAVYALVIPYLELNASHLLNEAWPAHARLHEAWQLTTNAAIGLIALWLAWGRNQIRIASLLNIAVMGGVLVAHLFEGSY